MLQTHYLLPGALLLHGHAEGERELGVLVGIDAELEAAAARRHHVRAGAILALEKKKQSCRR